MSQISQLKEHEDNNASLLEILQVMYPEMKTKYYELLVKLLKSEIASSGTDIGKFSPFQALVYESIGKYISNKTSAGAWGRFVDYNERNLIKDNDLSRYKRFSDVNTQVKNADEVEELKKLESEVIKIIENDEWLIIKPLSHKSSAKYGYGTKWCTAMQDQKSYFEQYTGNGALVYCINKKTKDKWALHKKFIGGNELTWWNVTDQRVDLLETNIPSDIMEAIRTDIMSKNLKTNAQLKKEFDSKNTPKSTAIATPKISIDGLTIPTGSTGANGDAEDLYRRALELMRRIER